MANIVGTEAERYNQVPLLSLSTDTLSAIRTK